MALSLAQKFINLGMPSPLAVEFANQLNTDAYNWKRLMWNSMVPDLAKYVAQSLAAGTFDPRIAMEKTMSEAVVTLTASGVAGSRSPVIGTLGDSRVNSAVNTGTSNGQPTWARTTYGLAGWLEGITRNKLKFPYANELGVSNQDSAYVLSTEIPQMLALTEKPTDALIKVLVNDINVTGLSDQQIKDNYSAIWSSLRAAGIKPIHILDPGAVVGCTFGGQLWTSAKNDRLLSIRSWVLANAPSYVAVVDTRPAYFDIGGTVIPGRLDAVDGVHPKPIGDYYEDQIIAAYFEARGLNPYTSTGTNILTNGQMTTPGGINLGTGASGTVPLGFRNRVTTGTAASLSSIEVRTDGGLGSWWQSLMTATTDALIWLDVPTAITAGATGEFFQLECDYEVDSAVNLRDLRLVLQETIAAGNAGQSIDGAGLTGFYTPANFAGTLRTNPIAKAPASLGITPRIQAQIDAGGSARIRVGNWRLVKTG